MSTNKLCLLALLSFQKQDTHTHTRRCSVCTGLPPPTVVTSELPYMLMILTHSALFYLSFNTNLKFNALILTSFSNCLLIPN